jgi:hypothetical protein
MLMRRAIIRLTIVKLVAQLIWLRLASHSDSTPKDSPLEESAKYQLELLQQNFSASRKTPAPSGLLIDLLVPPERAEDMLLHLQKAFDRWSLKYGRRCARRMFAMHSIGAVVGFWIGWIRDRLDLFKWFA